MKSYFILLCLLLPIFVQANDKKFSLLEKAEKHKQEAIKWLEVIDNKCYLIPNLRNRQHMHALIAAAMAAPVISDPREKILAVGLSLMGSLATEMYDKYCDHQSVLAQAAYHMEMSYFYSTLSFKIPEIVTDRSSRAFLTAIDCLTACDMMIWLLDDDAWPDTSCAYVYSYQYKRRKLSNEIVDVRGQLLDSYLTAFKQYKGKIPKMVYNVNYLTGLGLYENISEILPDCLYPSLRKRIYRNLDKMVTCLEIADKSCKVK